MRERERNLIEIVYYSAIIVISVVDYPRCGSWVAPKAMLIAPSSLLPFSHPNHVNRKSTHRILIFVHLTLYSLNHSPTLNGTNFPFFCPRSMRNNVLRTTNQIFGRTFLCLCVCAPLSMKKRRKKYANAVEFTPYVHITLYTKYISSFHLVTQFYIQSVDKKLCK